MPLSAAMAARAAALACLLPLAVGTPTVSFPVNAQVPPVARIAQPFSFVFAPNTFTSSSSIAYSLDNPPNWLAIDSSQRWLHGTPQDSDVPAGDVVGVPVSLVATDDTGSTMLNVTLVVSRTIAPTVQIPIAQQLANSGLPYSEPSSVLSYPSSPFSLTFSPKTFSGSGLNYYAVSGNNSPLPSWISFDPALIAFTGTTPPAESLVEPPETFNLQLVASDVSGFSAVAISFSIVVGSHELTVDDPAVVLNATVGKALAYNGLQKGVKMDGQVVGPRNLTATIVSGTAPPDWLTFDNSTWSLSGTPPSSAQNAAFVISFADAILDTVNVTFQVDIDENGTIFSGMLPAVQVERGSQFSVNLAPYLLETPGIRVAVQTEPDEDWIHFDNSTLTVSGSVPISEAASSISISVRATLESSQSTESETFMLQIVSKEDSANLTTSATEAPASAPTSKGSTATVAASKASSSSTSARTILLAVLIPILLLALVVAIVACCMCRRRRRENRSQRRDQEKHLSIRDISHPVPMSFAYRGQDDLATSMRELDREYRVNDLPKAYAQKPHQINGQSEPVGMALTTTKDEARLGPDMTEGKLSSVPSTIPDFPKPPLGAQTEPPSSSSSSQGRTRGDSNDDGRGEEGGAKTAGQWPFEESTLLSSTHTRGESAGNDSISSHEQSGCHDALGIYSGTGGSPSLSNQNNSVSIVTMQTVRTNTAVQLSPLSLSTEAEEALGGPPGSYSEYPVSSQEAIIHNASDSVGSTAASGGSVIAAMATSAAMMTAATINRRSTNRSGNNDNVHSQHSNHSDAASMRAEKGESRSTLYSGGRNNDNNIQDIEKVAGGSLSGRVDDGAYQATVKRKSGFLSTFASLIVGRLRKGIQSKRGAGEGPSTGAAADLSDGRGYLSPDTASFETDMSSAMIGSITTAQPYRPKPVFISNVNTITEESPQPNSFARMSSAKANSLWTRGSARGQDSAAHANDIALDSSNSRRTTTMSSTKQKRLEAYHQATRRGVRGANIFGDEEEDEDADEAADDEAIRLDPPRPVFLAPSHVEHDVRSSDLSHEIANSLGSRRPTSTDSEMSGISATMEEVRSLLLLPYDRHSVQSRGRSIRNNGSIDGDDDGLTSPSSNSWETLSSSDGPNWTSLYDFSLPPGRQVGIGGIAPPHTAVSNAFGRPTTGYSGLASTPDSFDTNSQFNGPPTPAMGSGWMPGRAVTILPLQTQAQAAAEAAAAQAAQIAHNREHPTRAAFVFPMREPNPRDDREIGNVGNSEDEGLQRGRQGHTSSYDMARQVLGGDTLSTQSINAHENEGEHSTPFIMGSSESEGSVMHRYDGHSFAYDGDGAEDAEDEDRPSRIGLAMTKYSQPHLPTEATLPSVSSGGVKAFI